MTDNTAQVEQIFLSLDEIKPYSKNPRKNDKAVDPTGASIDNFAYDQYIVVDDDHVIIKGHTRLQALKRLNDAGKLGKGKLKGISADKIPVLVNHLTKTEARASRIVDNRTAEYATWDDDLLKEEIAALGEELDLGVWDMGANKDLNITEDNGPGPLPEEPKTKIGQIYRLGKHYLMIGDATKAEDLKALIKASGGELADLIVTDPPYNVNYEEKERALLKSRPNKRVKDGVQDGIEYDTVDDITFREFLTKAFIIMFDNAKNGAPFYIWSADLNSLIFRQALEDAGQTLRQVIIWVKTHFSLGHNDYQWMHEPCLYGWKEGPHYFTDNRTLTTVVEEEPPDIDGMTKDQLKALISQILSTTPTTVIKEQKPLRNALHPTMKPIKLLARLISNSSKEGAVVLDPFGGSGSTLITCEQMNRRCVMMELSPRYADVILSRWQEYTGQEVELIKG